MSVDELRRRLRVEPHRDNRRLRLAACGEHRPRLDAFAALGSVKQ